MQVLIKGNIKVKLLPVIVDDIERRAVKQGITIREWIERFAEKHSIEDTEKIGIRVTNYCYTQLWKALKSEESKNKSEE